MKRGLLATIILTITVSILVPSGTHAIPTMGVYFSAPGCSEHSILQPEPFTFFPAYIYLCDANHFVTAVEYQLQTPTDPSHALFIVVDAYYPNRKVIWIGDPLQGHAIAFWPPLDGFTDGYNFICAFNCITLAPCGWGGGDIIDYPIVIGPDPRSGHLRGTYYPNHELFEIYGTTAILCEGYGHCTPYIEEVVVQTPMQIQARFTFKVDEASAEDPSHYSVYETWNPESTIPVTGVTMLADSQTVLVDLGSELSQEIGSYSLRADNIRDFEGWPHNCPSVATLNYCPDLRARNLVVEPDGIYEACTPYDVDFDIVNAGQYQAGPFRTSVRFNWNTGEGMVEEIMDTIHCGGLAAGETLHVHSNFIMPPVRDWNQYVKVYADDLEQVPECFEDNNRAEKTLFNYTPCILSITDMPDDTGGWVSMTFSKAYLDRTNGAVTGYEIYRRTDPPPGWDLIELVPAVRQPEYTVPLPTMGDSTEAGIYWSVYYIQAVTDPPDTSRYISCPDSGYSVDNFPVSDTPEQPRLPLTLYQNYPNPFNPVTTLSYHLPEAGRVVLEIFDVSGRRLIGLVDKDQEPGHYEVTWDGRDAGGVQVSSGVYFYRLRAGVKTISRKMAVLR
ncbi:MAG: T9SS type A sorting domain-containing protein [bacterium]|nr:MAG: T9SS type A sorting domain-containing protein [bacterium]